MLRKTRSPCLYMSLLPFPAAAAEMPSGVGVSLFREMRGWTSLIWVAGEVGRGACVWLGAGWRWKWVRKQLCAPFSSVSFVFARNFLPPQLKCHGRFCFPPDIRGVQKPWCLGLGFCFLHPFRTFSLFLESMGTNRAKRSCSPLQNRCHFFFLKDELSSCDLDPIF